MKDTEELRGELEGFLNYLKRHPATKEWKNEENITTVVFEIGWALYKMNNGETWWLPSAFGYSVTETPRLISTKKPRKKRKSLTPKNQNNGTI